MANGRTDEYPYADTPLARWLWAKMGGRSLRHIERDSGVRASLLSNYLTGQTVPRPPTIKRLARYFGVSPSEIAALLPDPLREPLTPADDLPLLSVSAVDQIVDRVTERVTENLSVMLGNLAALSEPARREIARNLNERDQDAARDAAR